MQKLASEEKKRQNLFAVAFTCSCMFPWTTTAEICNPVLLVNSNQLSHLSLHTLQHSTRKKHQNSHVNYPPENDSRTHNHRFSSLFHSFTLDTLFLVVEGLKMLIILFFLF